MSRISVIFEYDKELEEKKLRKAEYEYGFSEGKKTGFQNAAMETARRMLKSNKLSLEDIADLTPLKDNLLIFPVYP